jgi:hypothetical protein
MAMFADRNGGQWQGRPVFLLVAINCNEPHLLSGPKGVIRMAGMLKVSRSRGALSGVLLLLLGIWGGLIPLVGPYVHYAYTPDHAWRITSGRIWLEILPAAGAVLGGFILLISRLRPMALFGASLAAASGAWFAVGSALAPIWTTALPAQGRPLGGQFARAMEQIGFFAGLGVVIVCIAAVALGRLSLVSVRDASVRGRAATSPIAIPAAKAGATAGADPDASTSRWPIPLTSAMRRVASTSASRGGGSGSDEPVGSTTSKS